LYILLIMIFISQYNTMDVIMQAFIA